MSIMISVVTNSITLKRKIIFIGYKILNLIEVAQTLYHFSEQFLVTSLLIYKICGQPAEFILLSSFLLFVSLSLFRAICSFR